MKICYSLLLLSAISGLAQEESIEKKAYEKNTLQYALYKAHTTHPELQSQKYTVDASKFSYESSKGAWLPTLDVSANVGPEKSVDRISTANGRAKNTENEILEVYNARLRQVLFDGGLRGSIIDQNHEQLSQSRNTFDETREGISFSVISAYVEILKQQKLLLLSEDNYDRHKDLYDKVKKRFNSKRETKVSLYQAESRLLRAENGIVQSKNHLKQAKVSYRQLVGESPVLGLLDVTLKDFKIEKTLFEAFSISEKHPALLRANSQITQARAGVQGAKSRFSPEIAVEGGASYDRYANGIDAENEEYNLLLTANWNLFNGFQDKKNYQASISRLYASSSLKDSVRRTIFENVEDSWIELSKLKRNVEILDKQKDLSQFTADGYVEQYDKSSRSLFDVLNTQADAYSSETAYISALYDEVVAFARLGFFMGDLSRRVVGYHLGKNSETTNNNNK
ncbi:TolC family protein [Lentisphaera profundi]|uniref:TolC family protein n=1 Tax=Lentisphaera profundi TaxID=1658616 RepID=A0ABY7VY86_9BACT|nr:TolC family protein [Lentisphaera profundi]WDE99135.1 TolC family protein [Lentisphaera profundi]